MNVGKLTQLLEIKVDKNARDYPLTDKTDNLGDAVGWVAEWLDEW